VSASANPASEQAVAQPSSPPAATSQPKEPSDDLPF